MKYPYLLWEGTDGIDEIRLVVTGKSNSGYDYVMEACKPDALGEDSWSASNEATHVITDEETFVPCLVAGLVDLLMSGRQAKETLFLGQGD
jgi:hypothetical protein